MSLTRTVDIKCAIYITLNLVCEKCTMAEMYLLYVSKAKKAQNCIVCKYVRNFYLRCNLIPIYTAPTVSKTKVPVLSTPRKAALYD